MNRREALQKTALALGYAVSAPALAGLMQGCKPSADSKTVFLNDTQATLLGEVTEIIIPRTDTPGAKEAGVPAFIDQMLREVYPKKDQDRFLEGLTALDDEARKVYGNPFVNCEKKHQVLMVKKSHDEALAANAPDQPFILMAKELTLLGFFTSEPGATQVLQYNQSPGPYHGCVPLAEVGKAWAT